MIILTELKYTGTRNDSVSVSASYAVLKGICDDGGLFAPSQIPKPDLTLEELCAMDYKSLAYEIMKLYLTDYTKDELMSCINAAYDEKFDDKKIAPLIQKGGVGFLELFHGKTLAFKDMALSILPHLLKTAAKKQGQKKEIVILTATSGDTGKAAMEGFADVDGTRIIVFFPEDGVSPVQKRQMVTQTGANTCVVGIKGNFDDAQNAVKEIFTDKDLENELFENGFVFSSANSINIGRLVPQIVYYFYAYAQMAEQGSIHIGDKINFSVPTGNFGNILAGYYAKCMGLPVNRLICASNDNKVLYDFFNTGSYNKNREFVVTVSPSMDILISSNLERLVFMKTGAAETKKLMEALKSSGEYSLKLRETNFTGEFATKEETFAAIKKMHSETGYVMDTHTSVAYAAYEKYKAKSGDSTPAVIISTASPYKFAGDVLAAINGSTGNANAFPRLSELEKLSGVKIPAPIANLENEEIRHSNVCERNEIKDFIKNRLLNNK